MASVSRKIGYLLVAVICVAMFILLERCSEQNEIYRLRMQAADAIAIASMFDVQRQLHAEGVCPEMPSLWLPVVTPDAIGVRVTFRVWNFRLWYSCVNDEHLQISVLYNIDTGAYLKAVSEGPLTYRYGHHTDLNDVLIRSSADVKEVLSAAY